MAWKTPPMNKSKHFCQIEAEMMLCLTQELALLAKNMRECVFALELEPLFNLSGKGSSLSRGRSYYLGKY
jgi:hypothetical protein